MHKIIWDQYIFYILSHKLIFNNFKINIKIKYFKYILKLRWKNQSANSFNNNIEIIDTIIEEENAEAEIHDK